MSGFFDDLSNKRVLRGCQTDVPGGHLGLAQVRIQCMKDC
jgi:hypothetical protein